MEEEVPPPLISISLDIAGSTAAKSEIVKRHGQADPATRELYRELLRQFYRVEAQFYDDLFKTGLTPEQVFLVKTIGDEAWIVVEVPPEASDSEFTMLANAVLQAGAVAVYKVIGPVGSLQLKMFVDYLPVSIELTAIRGEEFKPLVRSAVARDTTADPAEVTREIYDRLGGTVTVAPGHPKSTIASRSDFMGLDVDRFFRCSKFVEDGSVAMGRAFAERLALHESALPSIDEKREEICLAVPTGPSSTRYERFLVTRETVSKRQLKGLSTGYAIFHVAQPTLDRLKGQPALSETF